MEHTHNIGTKTDRQSCFWSVRFQLYFFNVYASVKYPRTSEKSVIYLYIRWWWWLLLTSTFFSRLFQFCFFFEFLNWHWHKTVFWNVTNITLNFVWIHSVTIDDDKQDKLRYFFLLLSVKSVNNNNKKRMNFRYHKWPLLLSLIRVHAIWFCCHIETFFSQIRVKISVNLATKSKSFFICTWLEFIMILIILDSICVH